MTTLLLFVAGLAAPVVGSQLLVRGASKLALSFGALSFGALSFGALSFGTSPQVAGLGTLTAVMIGVLAWRGGHASPRG